jgi:hypothetical protein
MWPAQLAEDNAGYRRSSSITLLATFLNEASGINDVSRGFFCITIILQTTSVVDSKKNPSQLTKPVNTRENCSCHVKTRDLHVKTGTHHGYMPTQKV